MVAALVRGCVRVAAARAGRLFQKDQLIREDTLTQGVIKIGKVPSAHLQITDDSVSRMHAIVEVTGRDVHLIDLGSTRGTFVNGKKINKARLETGDTITVGDTRIEIAIRDAAPVPEAAAATAEPSAGPAKDRAAAPPSIASAASPTIASPAAWPLSPVASSPSAAGAPPPIASAASPTIASAAASPLSSVASSSSAPAAPPPIPSRARGSAAATVSDAAAVPRAQTATISGVIDAAPRPAEPLWSPPSAIAAAPARALPLETAVRPAALSHVLAESTDEPGAARAIEVAAMLGDSVVSVKHCLDPRAGKVTPATWGLVAGGAACLLASAIAFGASLHNAADNHERFDTWTRVEHRPAYAFRPRELGLGVDWVAFGGLGLAVLGLALGIVRMRNERVSPYYRIGTAPGVELALEDAPAPAFPLIAPSGDDFVFNYAAGIDGELLLDGTSTPLAELAAAGRSRPSASTAGAIEVPIPSKARIRARAGRTTFLVSAVPRPRRHAIPLLAGLESRAAAYFAGSLVVHLAVWGVLQAMPPDATGISVDLRTDEPTLVRLQGTEHNDPPPEALPPGTDSGAPTASAPLQLPPAAAGKPDATTRGHLQVARADTPPQLAMADAIAGARTAGPLGVIADALSGPTIDGLPRGRSSGIDAESFNGPLYGGDGEGPGRFGNSLTDLGVGSICGDPPCGPYAVGGYTMPRGPRSFGTSYGIPGRGPHMPGHEPILPRVGEPKVTQGAGYDKTIIRRYIRRNIDKIGYCYDKQLLVHPDLSGAITVTFFITPSGGVQSSSGSGFDAEIAGCVAGVIQAIEFPKPGDGIGVQVTYPFHFHAAGSP
ncbi:MAG: FHA domain-containing protein [Deltaproteobacteria bacterium]|nr:MAG: FHA domain-containing protein [Deltaproteobacteria bacterium]